MNVGDGRVNWLLLDKLKSNVGDNLQDYHFIQNSQIFSNEKITIKVTKTKVSENANAILFRLVGDLDREKLSNSKLKEQ